MSRCHWIRAATWRRECWEISLLFVCDKLTSAFAEARVQDTAKFKLLVQKLKSRRPMNWFVSNVFLLTATAFRRGSDSHQQLIAGIWVLWASCWVNSTEEHEKAALHRSSAGSGEGVSAPCLLDLILISLRWIQFIRIRAKTCSVFRNNSQRATMARRKYKFRWTLKECLGGQIYSVPTAVSSPEATLRWLFAGQRWCLHSRHRKGAMLNTQWVQCHPMSCWIWITCNGENDQASGCQLFVNQGTKSLGYSTVLDLDDFPNAAWTFVKLYFSSMTFFFRCNCWAYPSRLRMQGKQSELIGPSNGFVYNGTQQRIGIFARWSTSPKFIQLASHDHSYTSFCFIHDSFLFVLHYFINLTMRWKILMNLVSGPKIWLLFKAHAKSDLFSMSLTVLVAEISGKR